MKVALPRNCPTIDCPRHVHEILEKILVAEIAEDRDKEHFWVFQLDARNKIKSLHLVTLGTLTTTLVHPREVFTRAVADRCASIIVAHNHPSGDAQPSHEDELVTYKLVSAGDLLDIKVLDHIITAGDTFYSFKEHGQI